jgi:hypothetical protein
MQEDLNIEVCAPRISAQASEKVCADTVKFEGSTRHALWPNISPHSFTYNEQHLTNLFTVDF